MKVLFVHEKFGDFGGAEANILATASGLRNRGHEAAILSGAGTGKGEAAWAEAFSRRYQLEPVDAPGSARQAVGSFQPDVVYVHKLSDAGALGSLLDTGVPSVCMVHDHELVCLRGCKYHYLGRKICTRALSPYCVVPCGGFVARNGAGWPPLKWVSYAQKKTALALHRRFDRVITNSEFMRTELVRNGFPPRAVEVHAPVPCDGEPAGASSFSPRNVLVYAGQIIRGKGVDVLIESLARVREPFECYVLGDGGHRGACERLARRLGLADRVHFCGFMPKKEIAAYYRDCTAAVVSSVWPEPFGMAGIEAMRYGLPVVAFDAGGIREWLIDGYNGYLVPWMDRGSYAARVQELLRDKDLARRLGEAGRRLAAQSFGFSNYIQGLENMLARLAARTSFEAQA